MKDQEKEKVDLEDKTAEVSKEQLADKIIQNRKRTFKMFEAESTQNLQSSVMSEPLQTITQLKIKARIDSQYANLGKIPGIEVSSTKRRCILKNINIDPAPGFFDKTTTQDETSEIEEAKQSDEIGQVSMST